MRPDSPISTRADDAFGFSGTAEKIAKGIATSATDTSLIRGVFGPWGSGKSSLINLTIRELEGLSDPPPTVVHFTPWLYDSDADLLIAFAREIQTAVNTSSRAIEALHEIVRYAKVGLQVLATAAGAPALADSIAFLGASHPATQREALATLKQTVTEELRQDRRQGAALVVVVDDLDRLDPPEAVRVLRTIYTLGTFPGSSYLIAADDVRLIRHIDNVYGYDKEGEGRLFLDKIVHTHHRVLRPLPSALSVFLSTNVKDIFPQPNHPIHTILEPNTWVDVLDSCVTLLRTPRDAARLIIALASLGDVLEQVDSADLLLAEALRVVTPELHAAILDNPQYFVGPPDPEVFDERDKVTPSEIDTYYESRLDRLLAHLPEASRYHVRDTLLPRLFPRARTSAGISTPREQESPAGGRTKRRLSDIDAFRIYATLNPEGVSTGLSLKTLLAFTEVADGTRRLSDLLKESIGPIASQSAHASSAVDHRLVTLDELGTVLSRGLSREAAVDGFRWCESQLASPKGFEFDVLEPTVEFSADLCRGIAESDVVPALESANATILGTLLYIRSRRVHCPGDEYSSSKRDSEGREAIDALISREHLEELEDLLLRSYREQGEKLAESAYVHLMLRMWQAFDSSDNVAQSVSTWSDEALLSSLRFLRDSRSPEEWRGVDLAPLIDVLGRETLVTRLYQIAAARAGSSRNEAEAALSVLERQTESRDLLR